MDTNLSFFKCWESDTGHVLIWTLPDKISHWLPADNMDAVVSYVERLRDGRNVYIGAGLSPEAMGRDDRCPSASIAGISGFWIDVDILSPVHKKKNLPATEEEALELIRSVGPEPSYIIHSGNGFQAWWMFRELWMFDQDGERQDAASLAAAWNKTFRIRAAERGWDVDATHDLARVMRAPGTLNQKTRPPKPVEVFLDTGLRYNPSDLEEYVVDREFVQTQKVMATFEASLNPDASPPFEKYEALMANNPKAKSSWDRKRTDLQDQSPSSYDMSLALLAAQANWTDQEIVDLLIASRRKHGDDLKLRLDYYERTVNRARSALAQQVSDSDLSDMVAETARALVKGTPLEREQSRQGALKQASGYLGVNVLRMVKFTSDPPTYWMETSLGAGQIGGSRDLISYTIMRARILDFTKTMIPRFSSKKWDYIVQLLTLACDDESAGEEATDSGAVTSWLTDYLSERPPMESPEAAAMESSPYVSDGHVHIFGQDFQRFLALSRMEKITAKEMGVKLRNHKCEPSILRLEISGRRTSRSVWRLPSEYSVYVVDSAGGGE